MINETDLAPYLGADLAVMESSTRRMRQVRPYVLTPLKASEGLAAVVEFIERRGLLNGG